VIWLLRIWWELERAEAAEYNKMRLPQVCLGLLVGLLTVQALPSPDPPRSNSFLPFHSSALFSVDPLTSVRRSFQDIQAGVGRSMRSLMAAGSAIGHRMLGMITRAPSIIVIVVAIVIIFILIIIMFLLIIRTALPCAPLVLLWPSPSG